MVKVVPIVKIGWGVFSSGSSILVVAAVALDNLTLNADPRGDRNPDPTLGPQPDIDAPTLFDGGVSFPP